MDESGAWAKPPPHRVCRKPGFWSCPTAGSRVERRRRLEASPCYDWSGIQVFCVPLPPTRVKKRPGTLPLAAIVGRMPQEPWDARLVTMTTAAPGKSEVGGCGKAPPPCRCCLGEKRPLGPPAHPPCFVTRSPSLQRRNNTPSTH